MAHISDALAQMILRGLTLDKLPKHAAYYPPVPNDDLIDARAYEGVFDRVVVTQKGVYGRRGDGNWTELVPLSKVPQGDWPFPPPSPLYPQQSSEVTTTVTPVFKPGDRVIFEKTHSEHPAELRVFQKDQILLVETPREDGMVKFVGNQNWWRADMFKLIDQG